MPIDNTLLEKQINQLLSEEFEIPLSKLTPESNLYSDLEIDSLDGIDMIVAIEKKYKVRINEKRGMQIRTVADVYRFVKEELAENGIEDISSLWPTVSNDS
jgi:acyl carrier protein